MSLTSEELLIIRAHGVPLEIDPRFVLREPDGCVRFTERGRELYRVALLMYGLSPTPVDEVRTAEDVRNITLKVKHARLVLVADEAERAASDGKIPVRSREIVNALLHGTVEDFHDAVERRLACEAAGENVIPFSGATR